MADDQYELHVKQATQRGLADCEAGRTVPHAPLVHRGDSRVAALFHSVAWTVSARAAVEETFGSVFDASASRDHILEQALDKAAYALTTMLGSAEAGSKAGEVGLMWGQARLLYRVLPAGILVVAVVPSVERWNRMIEGR